MYVYLDGRHGTGSETSQVTQIRSGDTCLHIFGRDHGRLTANLLPSGGQHYEGLAQPNPSLIPDPILI